MCQEKRKAGTERKGKGEVSWEADGKKEEVHPPVSDLQQSDTIFPTRE